MPLDGLFLHHLTNELSETLHGARINKIYQLSNTEFLFQLKIQRKKRELYISLNPNSPRINFTSKTYFKPEVPPKLCMSLRKQIEGAIILEVTQNRYDRVLILKLIHTNEVGDKNIKYLFLELMGRHSNMILTTDKHFVIDAMRFINNEQRIIMPKRLYLLPDILKEDPINMDLSLSEEDIQKKYHGLSKQTIKELKTNPHLSFYPTMIQSTKDHFYFSDLTHISGNRKHFDSLSELLDNFYYKRDEDERIKNQAQNISRFIKNELNKLNKKLKNLEKDIDSAEKAERFKNYGDLIFTYAYQMKRGDTEAHIFDFEGNELLIPLDPLKTPSENAQKYYHRYQKSKNGLVQIQKQIDKTNDEIEYFESVETLLSNASLKDALEIKEELEINGYMKKSVKKVKIRKNKKPAFETFKTPDGIDVLVGKNNIQNDFITFKEARPNEIWMHAKDMPGSHVIIKTTEPSEITLRYAANLAALYSKGKQSSSVPIDYTQAKNIKRIPNSKMGFVRIKDQKTIYIDPDESLV